MSCVELLKKELKKEFPSIDRDLQTYVEGEKNENKVKVDNLEEIN